MSSKYILSKLFLSGFISVSIVSFMFSFFLFFSKILEDGIEKADVLGVLGTIGAGIIFGFPICCFCLLIIGFPLAKFLIQKNITYYFYWIVIPLIVSAVVLFPLTFMFLIGSYVYAFSVFATGLAGLLFRREISEKFNLK